VRSFNRRGVGVGLQRLVLLRMQSISTSTQLENRKMVLEYYWTMACNLIGAVFSSQSSIILRLHFFLRGFRLYSMQWLCSYKRITEWKSLKWKVLRSLNWVDSRAGFDRRTYEYSKICKSTDLHILLCKHAIIFGLSGSRRIYQPMFCPDVRARRRGAELL
jgi:hypothetical protein